MWRRFSGGGGGGGFKRLTRSLSVGTSAGAIATLPIGAMTAPVSCAKTGGDADLSVNASTGVISSAAGIPDGTTRSISGTMTSTADGCVRTFSLALTGAAPAPSPGYSFVNAEAAAFIARQDGHTLSDDELEAFDTFVGALKAAGVWATADQVLWLTPALPNPMLNLVGETRTATRGAGVVDVPDNPSLFSSGAAGAAITGMASNAGANFTQNSAAIGAWAVQNGTRTSAPVSDSVSRNLLSFMNGSSKAVGRVNSNTSMTSTANVASGSGFLLAVRSSATLSSLWKSGAQLATSNAAAQLLTANPILFGTGSMAAGYALTWIGGGLTDDQAIALTNAVDTFMAATGVHALAATTAALAMDSSKVWPDAAGIGDAGDGLPCTGLCLLADGTWLVGVGLGTISDQAGVMIVSADKTTVVRQVKYADWGMTAYSTQGVTVDSNGDGLCVAKNSGTEARLVRFSLSTGAKISDSALPSPYSNGLAVDTKRNRLVVSSSTPNAITWLHKDTDASPLTADAAIPVISFACDQLAYHAATDSLLATGGNNGVPGIFRVYTAREYGAMWLKRDDTTTGTLAIEGVAISDYDAGTGQATLTFCDDGHTHNQAYDRNRATRYVGVPI